MILRNAIKTPDGTILESTHIHDYKSHYDEVTNEVYFVDGGMSYIRSSINKVPAEKLYVDSETSPHEEIRKIFKWGTRGKDGNAPIKYVKLKELSISHIKAILKTQNHISGKIHNIFKNELKYRALFGE